jgi:hypothetical protein
MNEFEVRERLRRAIGETDPPPGMEAAIEARLMRAKPREYPRGLGLLAAVLALVLALGVLLALDPGTRTALADRLGLRGVTISQVPFVPTAISTPARSRGRPSRSAGSKTY